MGPVLRRGALGLALGVVWGVAARVWMRLVTDEPEFTWFGTLQILALAALLGGLAGVATGALRSGRTGWWRLAVVPGLLLFLSPGVVLLPGCVVGGVAAARRSARGWLVAGLAAFAAPALFLVTVAAGEPPSIVLSTALGMPLLTVAIAWWWRDLFTTRRGRANAARRGGRAAFAEEDDVRQLTASRASTTPSPK